MVEEIPELVAAHGGEHFEVLDPNRDHFVVGIGAEVTDPLKETSDHIGFLIGKLLDPRAVDGRIRTSGQSPHDLQEEAFWTHPVELRQLAEPLERDTPFRPLVPGHGRWLEPSVRPRAHVAKRHTSSLPSPS